ncbi:MAG: hypothetical protein BWX70_00759 [Verrucomicrobia bacterium ADurb.Bin070]|nr:MAG: hypothetical protein BWX70_00759 [Verrucomicrobia bacterium ADurb.Bin070]
MASPPSLRLNAMRPADCVSFMGSRLAMMMTRMAGSFRQIRRAGGWALSAPLSSSAQSIRARCE